MEILIAAFILALGILGLTALFAGAAAQQQFSTQLSRSVSLASSGAAFIQPKLGLLSADGADSSDIDNYKQPLPVLTDLPLPCNSGATMVADRWYPVPAREELLPGDDEETRSVSTLSLNPALLDGGLYFLAEEDDPIILYERMDEWPPPGQPIIQGTQWSIGNTLPAPYNMLHPYFYTAQSFQPLDHSRVWARSVELTVSYATVATGGGGVVLTDPVTGNAVIADLDEVRYSWISPRQANDAQAAGYPHTPGINIWNDPNLRVFYRQGRYPPLIAPDYFILNIQNELGPGAFNAWVDAFDLGIIGNPANTNVVVDKIVINSYLWRSDRLATDNDRIFYVDDPEAPDGRRPEIGYSMLFRPQELNTWVAFFAYTIQPLSVGGRFVPPETCADYANDEAVLREIEVELAYDESREQYYVTVPVDDGDDSLAWALEAGSILLFAGNFVDLSDPNADPDDKQTAADLPVRIINRYRVDNNWRAYLDDVPRASGRAMLPFHDSTLETTSWVINDVVQSADGSLWRLRPIEMSIFVINRDTTKQQ